MSRFDRGVVVVVVVVFYNYRKDRYSNVMYVFVCIGTLLTQSQAAYSVNHANIVNFQMPSVFSSLCHRTFCSRLPDWTINNSLI